MRLNKEKVESFRLHVVGGGDADEWFKEKGVESDRAKAAYIKQSNVDEIIEAIKNTSLYFSLCNMKPSDWGLLNPDRLMGIKPSIEAEEKQCLKERLIQLGYIKDNVEKPSVGGSDSVSVSVGENDIVITKEEYARLKAIERMVDKPQKLMLDELKDIKAAHNGKAFVKWELA